MITSNVAFYPCISIEKTDKFYSELLGLKTVFSGEKTRIYSANKGHFGFVEYEKKILPQDRLCLSFNCESKEGVNSEYERIVSNGGKPMGKPCVHANFPVYSFFIKDPNGYTVEFQKIEGIDI